MKSYKGWANCIHLVVGIFDFIFNEKKWQNVWEKNKLYETNVSKKKKFFTSLIIPYVNGNSHIGHSFTYTRTDCYARYKRMRGFNVLLAQGFHATGEPILGVIERLKKGDSAQISTLKMYGANDDDIKDFIKNGPEHFAKFWMEKMIESMKSMGFAVDWRRMFITAIDPKFNRFIEWQYNTLKKKGFVIQGTHPVVWCPKDQSPTGDHDRLYGEGESPQEFALIKFVSDDSENIIFPCGTLRPETIYGATNLWVREDSEYVIARVDNEKWFVSAYAAEKLRDQLKNVDIISVVDGRDVIGKKCINPATKTSVPILHSGFVDTENATGVVMSVPAHAPLDWISIKEMIDNDLLEKYGINKSDLEPINVVKTPGLEENPAVKICEKMKITSVSQKEALEKATSDIYKKEFYDGIALFGEYKGKKISSFKEEMIESFRRNGIADIFWEIDGVVCRCTTRCHVKILENQWFLKYSDYTWKSLAEKNVSSIIFYPEDVRKNFQNTLNWLKDKACARKSGLGTKLPWDKEWIVETLSDSTIYMAYYTIANIINKNNIKSENLTDGVFDYVFLGKGSLEKLSKNSGIKKPLLISMKKEFDYFYPVDVRNSAKDLVQNHLMFYILHHVALWSEKKWPRAIGVNGYVNIEGEKMSKSRGNIIPLKDLVEQFGSDLVRVNIVASTEGIDDADWRVENIKSYRARLELINEIVSSSKKASRKNMSHLDRYLESKFNRNIQRSLEAYENMNFRTAVHFCLFENLNEIRWYIKRCGSIENCSKETLDECVEIMIKLLCPIIPHFCEEMWSVLGKKAFLVNQTMPKFDKNKINDESEKCEGLIKSVMNDVIEIQKIAKIDKLSKVSVFVSKGWKFEIFRSLNESDFLDIGGAIKNFGGGNAEKIKYIQHVFSKMKGAEKPLDREAQIKLLEGTKKFFKDHLGCEIEIVTSDDNEDKKALVATPHKPGIKIV